MIPSDSFQKKSAPQKMHPGSFLYPPPKFNSSPPEKWMGLEDLTTFLFLKVCLFSGAN